jgi:hypothetical protein
MRRATSSRNAHALSALTGVLLSAAAAVAADPAEVQRRAQQIRPAPHEKKWEQVPWLLDLNEAIRHARQEGRPLLLWGSDDDPLERC